MGVGLLLTGCGGAGEQQGGPSPTPTPSPSSLAAPVGMRVVSGSVTLVGVTSDGFIAYETKDAGGTSRYALPPAGGRPILIQSAATGGAFISGRLVVGCAGTNLHVWSTSGQALDVTNAGCHGVASADGKAFLYNTPDTQSNHIIDVHLASLDGSRNVVVATHVDATFSYFTGGRFVVDNSGEELGNTSSLFTVDPVSAQATTVTTDIGELTLATEGGGGTFLYITKSSGALHRVALDGSDSVLDAGPIAEARFGGDAGTVFYVTKSGAIRRWTGAGGALQLVDANAETDHPITYPVVDLSPDGQWMAFPNNSWWAGWISPAGAHSMPGAPLDCYIGGGEFTSDSKYFICAHHVDGTNQFDPFLAHPIDGGEPIAFDLPVQTLWPLGGSLLLQAAGASPVSTYQLALGAPGGATRLLTPGADDFTVSRAAGKERKTPDRIIYVTSYDPSTAGLYVYDVY
jgi:hypothetical protein